MIKFFNTPWSEVPTVFIDTETTGPRPGADRACSVAIVRFEGGQDVGSFSSLVNPGIPISAEATSIHGITNEQAQRAASIQDVFKSEAVTKLLDGAQPGAYNASFDRHMVVPFGDDWQWPWLDALSIVRVIDRYVKGSGRHKLEVTCQRHGVELGKAHDAEADARACGMLFYKIAPQFCKAHASLGELLYQQRQAEADKWHRFMGWLSTQPPRAQEP